VTDGGDTSVTQIQSYLKLALPHVMASRQSNFFHAGLFGIAENLVSLQDIIRLFKKKEVPQGGIF